MIATPATFDTASTSIMSPAKVERLRSLFDAAQADNTKKTYRKQFRFFLDWCSRHGVPMDSETVITPEVLAAHIEDLHHAGYRLDTIKARVRAVAAFHKEQQARFEKQGLATVASPTGHVLVTTVLRGMKNAIAGREQAGDRGQSKRKAEALWIEDLRALCEVIDDTTLAGKRNLAMLLVGWAGGFRRSELVGVMFEHLAPKDWGYVVTLHSTKTKKTVTKQIRREEGSCKCCPVRALEDWLSAASITTGPVFRSFAKGGTITNRPVPDKFVEDLVKTAAGTAKPRKPRATKKKTAADVATVLPDWLSGTAKLRPGKWSAHSLRRGYISQHLAWGFSEQAVRRQAGFTATSPVFFEYVEEARDHSECRSAMSKPAAGRG